MGRLKISLHSPNDWCHLCGNRSKERFLADVSYPANAEHGNAGREYVRICSVCAIKIVSVIMTGVERESTREERPW